MGHREDLLEGAKRCLIERGYSRTTARDIVEASHTNLGSIGYHYGTKDKLLLQAMVEMSGELAERMMAVSPRPVSNGPNIGRGETVPGAVTV